MVWDSGKVESSSTTDIPYDGPPLAAGTGYRWKVQTWDESGLASDWSSPAVFETELERTSGWHHQCISLGRIREDFRPPRGPRPYGSAPHAPLPAPSLPRGCHGGSPPRSARRC